MFCDGFEDPSLAAWGVSVGPGAMATRDAAFGFRGASLHATSPLGTDLADRFADVFPVSAPADEWVRGYVFVASGMTLDVEPLHLANAAGTHQLVFSLYDDATDIHAHGFATSVSAVGQAVPLRDIWVCYELHVAIGANGLVELYRDGALVVAQPAIDTRPRGVTCRDFASASRTNRRRSTRPSSSTRSRPTRRASLASSRMTAGDVDSRG